MFSKTNFKHSKDLTFAPWLNLKIQTAVPSNYFRVANTLVCAIVLILPIKTTLQEIKA